MEEKKQLEEDNNQDENIDKTDNQREKLAERFKSRMAKSKEELQQPDNIDIAFHASDPSTKYSTLWTILLVAMLIVAIGVIAFLLLRGGNSQSVVKTQEKLVVYNQLKEKYDQSLVDATNKLIEAENSFNAGDYADANDQAEDSEDQYSRTIDYIYDLDQLPMGDDFSYLSLYHSDLQELASLGEDMSSSLAYAARSADRSQYTDATKSLLEYQGYADEADIVIQQIETYKSSHAEFF